MTETFLLLCSALAYSGFCRLVRTSTRAVLRVRLASYLTTVGACGALYAVARGAYVPHWADLVLAAGLLALHGATARHWRNGLPPEYRAR